MIAGKIAFLILILLLALPRAMAQSQGDNSTTKTVEYRPGQLWVTTQGITVTVLAIQDMNKVGKVVHVRVDKIPFQSCGDVHLTHPLTLTESGQSKRSTKSSKCQYKKRS